MPSLWHYSNSISALLSIYIIGLFLNFDLTFYNSKDKKKPRFKGLGRQAQNSIVSLSPLEWIA
jgi:hypothetical protein